jgi:hypothetical protein
MLWTLVVALYLSIFEVIPLHPIGFTIFTVWLIVVGVLRMAFGRKVACLFSVVAGIYVGILRALLGWTVAALVSSGTGLFLPSVDRANLMDAVGGALVGLVVFLLVECGFRSVDWADRLMPTKTDD